MANIIRYDPIDSIVADKVIGYITSQHTPDWLGVPNVLINPDLSSVSAVSIIYWKRSGSSVIEMTAGEKTAVDADIAAQAAQAEADAKDFTTAYDKLDKAFSLVVLDEFNVVRGWLKDFKAEVASTVSLADLKTRIASLSAMNDRTIAQLKTSVSDKYDSL